MTGKWYIPVSVRLNDARGNFAGVLLASVNPDYFSMIFQEVTLGEDSLIYLSDGSGILYSGILDGRALELDSRIEPEHAGGIMNRKKPFTETGSSALDGVIRIRSFSFLSGRQMFVSVARSLDECLHPSRVRAFVLLGGQTIITVLIVFFSAASDAVAAHA